MVCEDWTPVLIAAGDVDFQFGKELGQWRYALSDIFGPDAKLNSDGVSPRLTNIEGDPINVYRVTMMDQLILKTDDSYEDSADGVSHLVRTSSSEEEFQQGEVHPCAFLGPYPVQARTDIGIPMG